MTERSKKIGTKKSLGQNFLKDKKILEKIIKESNIKKGENVLEIGPGKGHMTEFLLKEGALVTVIEKDKRLIPFLEEKFFQEIKDNKLKIFFGDALKIKYETIGFVNQGFKIVANLPYYITGKFLSTSLQNDIQPKKIVLLLQDEVVKRITLKEMNNKKSILSLSVKIYGEVKYVCKVSRKYFSPKPKVDSAILSISGISKKSFSENNIDENLFFKVVKQGFSSKRKFLLNNLKVKYKNVDKVFEKLDINKKTRAEDLDLEDWINIVKNI